MCELNTVGLPSSFGAGSSASTSMSARVSFSQTPPVSQSESGQGTLNSGHEPTPVKENNRRWRMLKFTR